MEGAKILEVITKMAKENNQGLQMTTTVLNAATTGVSSVTFRVTENLIESAKMQRINLPGEYFCWAFFIKRSEYDKCK